jgi:ubiquinol-cytochrome c reductase cytochrome b subunit
MGAEQGVGVVTFARFYTVHVLLLPPLTVLLIVLHVFLVRRHGVAPAPGDELKPRKKFYPGQVFRDTAAIFAVFALLFTLAVAVQAPLGRLADPTDTAYLPRPEWYFLFLFQLLKYFEGPLEVLASVVLPGLAVALLMAAPFLDRGAVRRVTQRTTALLIAGLAGIGWAGLTLAAIASTPPGAVFGDTTGPQQWRELSPGEVAGIGYFHREKCESCHALGLRAEPRSGPGAGPNLGAAATRRDAAWLISHFTGPAAVVPGSSMPPLTLSRSQLNSLASFLLRLTPENAEKLTETPVFAREGAILYQRHRCEMCHQVNGAGQPLGLSLNRLARRRDAAWVRGHFLDPQKYSPGTTMPAYKLTETENGQLSRYLLALP